MIAAECIITGIRLPADLMAKANMLAPSSRGKCQSGDDQIEMLPGQQFQSVHAVARSFDFVTVQTQDTPVKFAQELFVVDDKQTGTR